MIYLYNKQFLLQYYIENIVSLSWSEPFIGCGNFELEIPLVDDYYPLFNSMDWYVEKDGSDYTMIISKINVKDNGVDGIKSMVLSGESLESILKRRVVWGTLTTDGDLKKRIKKILDYNITCISSLSPNNANHGYAAYQNYRKIKEFSTTYNLLAGTGVYPKTDDDSDTSKDSQYTGDNVYDVMCDLCTSTEVQFRVKRNDDNKFEFSLRKGSDKKETVIIGDFLYDYENIEFYKDNTNYKNATIVGGANDWPKRCFAYYNSVSNPSGLYRYEVFVNAANEKEEMENPPEIAALTATYKKMLISKGREALDSAKTVSNFSGSFTKLFKERIESKEIQNGDIITIYSTKLGLSWYAKLTELSYSYDESGEYLTPTFEYYDK